MNTSHSLDDSAIEDQLSALAESFVQQYRLGKSPTIEEFANRYPELADRLRQLLPTLLIVEELGYMPNHSESFANTWETMELPKRIGDYRIIREIGRGGMGVVFEAEQISLARQVAIKILGSHATLDSRLIERFHVEARSAGSLHHPRIIPVYDVGLADGFHYYTMQRIDGMGLDRVLVERRTSCSAEGDLGSLSSRVDKASLLSANGPQGDHAVGQCSVGSTDLRQSSVATLSMADAPLRYYRDVARIGMQVAESLAYAHSKGILHRDIKPSNLILDGEGEVWIADFGLAKAFDPTISTPQGGLTATGDIVGTMRYMSPERFRGWSDPRSDVYGLGITLYELLTLQPAFPSEDRVVLMEQVLNQVPRAPRIVDPRVPRDLETIVLKAIDKEPAHRYSTASDLAADLRNFLEYRPIMARRANGMERLIHWSYRNPSLAGSLAAVVALLIIVAIGASLMSWRLSRALATSETLRGQAKQAETERTQQLRQSLLQEARSARSSYRPGSRFQSLSAVKKAAAIETGLDLRNEAIASMSLFDIRSTPEWTQPISSFGGALFGNNMDFFLAHDGNEFAVIRDREGNELQRFPARSFDGQFSPDDKYLLLKTGPRFGESGKELLQLMDWRSGRTMFELEGRFPGAVFDFHPDGTEWVVRTNDGKVAFYDLPQCSLLREFKLPGATISLKYHPHGKYLAFVEANKPIVFKLELQTGKIDRFSEMATGGLFGRISFNADGSMFASGSTNWRAYVWDTRTGKLKATLMGHNAEVVGALFAPNSNLLGTRSWDNSSRIWDVSNGQLITRIEGLLCGFSREGNRMAVVSGSVAGELLCAPSSELRILRGHRGQAPRSCCFSPDGRLLVSSGDESILFWDVHLGTLLGSISMPGTLTAEFAGDGRSLITASSAGVYHWPVLRHMDQVQIGPPVCLIDKPAHERRASLSPNSNECLIASESENQIERVSLDGSKLDGVPCGLMPNDCLVSPDGKWFVASSFRTRWCAVFDLKSLKKVRELPSEVIPSVSFSPDNQRLVISSRLGGQVFSTSTWEQITQLPRESDGEQLGVIAFDPSGSILAVARSDGIVKLLDGNDFHELSRLESPGGESIICMAFNKDATQLALCISGGVQLWNLGLIRERLGAMNLDWSPPMPARKPEMPFSQLQLLIDRGELPNRKK